MRSMSDGAGVSVRGVLVVRLSPRNVHVAALTTYNMCWSRAIFYDFFMNKLGTFFSKKKWNPQVL